MINHIYPETGKEFLEQHHAQLLKQAEQGRALAAASPAALRGRSIRRNLRKLAFAVILVLMASLAIAAITFASAGGGSGGGPYNFM